MKFFFLSILMLLTAACADKSVRDAPYIPDVKPLVAGAEFTETTVLGSIADVRLQLRSILKASEGLPSEGAVRDAVAKVEAANKAAEEAVAKNPAEGIRVAMEQLTKAIEYLRKEVAQLKRENAQLKDKNAATWHWVLNGGGVLFTLFAVASGFFYTSIPVVGPFLGPRIGILCGALAGALFILGYLYDWTQDNPVKTAAIVAGIFFTSVGLAWANWVRHKEIKQQ